ncbi:hypothetical protein [Vibrio sp. Hal054]|uniref:hypothetical protein n=1 Tax=Vibrio sp. Hal054 TaxID=3035158 RepID=UPI00301CF391
MHNKKINKTDYSDLSESIISDFKVSAKTSIYRKSESVPLRQLLKCGCIKGSVLNFGKGKYDTDSARIRAEVGNCTDYDYTYAPLSLELFGHHFVTAIAIYVVNTLPLRARTIVYQQMADATRKDGRAYFAVRSDKDTGIRGVAHYETDESGNIYQDGVMTTRGTYQIGFSPEQIKKETSGYFQFSRIISYKSGYLIIECSHSAISNG